MFRTISALVCKNSLENEYLKRTTVPKEIRKKCSSRTCSLAESKYINEIHKEKQRAKKNTQCVFECVATFYLNVVV